MFFSTRLPLAWVICMAGVVVWCVGCGEKPAANRDAMVSVPPGPSPALPEPTPVKVSNASPPSAPKTPSTQQPTTPATPPPNESAPAPVPKEKNLIENGSFERWAPRERVPRPWKHGFGYPGVDEMPSTVAKCTEEVPDGANALMQTWKRSDAQDSAIQQFGITLDSLKPNTSYCLTLRVKNESKGTVLVSPYALKSGDKPEVIENLKPGLVEVKPGKGFQDLKGYFQTKNETTVRIAAACAEGEYPVTAIWDDWRLVELGPAEKATGEGGEKQ